VRPAPEKKPPRAIPAQHGKGNDGTFRDPNAKSPGLQVKFDKDLEHDLYRTDVAESGEIVLRLSQKALGHLKNMSDKRMQEELTYICAITVADAVAHKPDKFDPLLLAIKANGINVNDTMAAREIMPRVSQYLILDYNTKGANRRTQMPHEVREDDESDSSGEAVA
jgi:hypothetical protein